MSGQEAAPLVIGDTMYLVAPYPNYLYALDLQQRGAYAWAPPGIDELACEQ